MDDRENLPDYESLTRCVRATSQNQFVEFTEKQLLYPLDRTIFGKGRDDDVTARFDRAKHRVDIGRPVFFACQEVKHRAVVPNIEGVNRKQDFCNVSFGPLHLTGSLAKASLCDR